MQQNPAFTIYNASAGSGKTFTLVKEYLNILFKSKSQDQYKRILALTFTNKAVAEMKERIIDMLKDFSNKKSLTAPNAMFVAICNDINIEPLTLHNKSIKLLETIIHNYAAFDISTIDGFTHRVIRTFAHDLKLPLNFEVELDQDSLLSEAVDRLITRAGSNKELTKILVDFAIEKADDNKSWDVTLDFNKIAKLLIKENDIPYIEQLKTKSLDDFKTLKTSLRQQIEDTKKAIKSTANGVLEFIEASGLEFTHFSRGTLPNHFKNAVDLKFSKLYANQLESNLANRKGLYKVAEKQDIKDSIDSILPQIEDAYLKTKKAVYHCLFLTACYKNITPLSVLNVINQELTRIKDEKNQMLISEFNTIISNELKNQPTPFIYERLGEKFKHYFIDEFQDTSVLQWENLIPLIDNSLSSENGSAMLVGDAKQAIYRWRGGKAEQFIELFNKTNIPFATPQNVSNLEANYRSFAAIVNFNNGFFDFLSQNAFSNQIHESLYNKASQNISKEEDGYVDISFLDCDKDDDKETMYCEQVLDKIKACQEQHYTLEDICVLVRRKKEGVAVANYLSKAGIDIVSSETLLIQNSKDVIFINDILTLLLHPKNSEVKISILNYLANIFKIEDKHHFFVTHIALNNQDLFKSFETFNIFIDPNKLLQLALYDLAETIVRSFNLVPKSNAYVQFYLDLVLDFTHKKESNLAEFLSYFDKKKDNLSIVTPKGKNAVQIMTIHKSKGLEFPVVIFPFADLDIYKEIEPKVWFPLDKTKFNGFENTLLNYNKDFENFGATGLEIYTAHQSEIELDHINLLYVALTRPVQQLYIITLKDITDKGVVNSKKYSGLFINYLKQLNVWDSNQHCYTFGDITSYVAQPKKDNSTQVQSEFISTDKEKHNIKVVTNSGYLWDTKQEAAIEKGNLIHNIMSLVNTTNDIDDALLHYVNKALINKEQALILKQKIKLIVDHPLLNAYYGNHFTIYNERDIITKGGFVLRPDRVVVNSNKEAIIIDYKTGKEDKKHEQQLQLYQDALEAMQLNVSKRILIYINEDIQVKMV